MTGNHALLVSFACNMLEHHAPYNRGRSFDEYRFTVSAETDRMLRVFARKVDGQWQVWSLGFLPGDQD